MIVLLLSRADNVTLVFFEVEAVADQELERGRVAVSTNESKSIFFMIIPFYINYTMRKIIRE